MPTSEPHLNFHKSSHIANESACVEVSEGARTRIRDTQNRESGYLTFPSAEWSTLLELTRATWRKSSYSSARGQDCVEVADALGASAVRDTQNREAGQLVFPSNEWAALLRTASRP